MLIQSNIILYMLLCIELCCIAARWRRDNWEIKLMEQPDEHYSLVGGNLVITNPRQKKHAGTYICVARNIYGTVISKEARVKFGCEHVNDPAQTATQKPEI